jgi:dihydrofolate reductase
MAKLVYSAITSLDGYVADADGNIDWSVPDPEVFEVINDLERDVDTVLYGRRMYETMVYWERFQRSDDVPSYVQDFAGHWRAQTKIVYSTTLEDASSTKTFIEHAFIPETVRQMKQSSEHDLSIGGAHLASQAIEARLVDEMHLFVVPVTVGSGTPANPGEFRTTLELLDVNRYESGIVHLHYRFDN